MSTTTTIRSGPREASAARREGGTFTGTGTLLRLMLRRDRVRIPLWIGGIALFSVSSGASFTETYPEAADRAAIAATMDLPATVAMLGPNHAGPDAYTYGAMFAHQMLVMTAVVVGLMSVLLLVRHTRAEEESGRAELVRATVVGSHAQPAAALLLVTLVNVVLGLVLAAALAGSGIETVDWSGSLLYGAALASVGLVLAGVAAVTVQVTEHARGASGVALAVLGGTYAVRAIGDVGDGTLTWLSPLGWAQQARPWVDDRWWPLLIALVVAVALVAAAFTLGTRRDVGAGLRQPRPGSATASDSLATPVGLAIRLQRGALIGWCVALALLGIMYGSIVGGAEDMLAELDAMQEVLPDISGADITESFAAMITVVLAMIGSIQAVQAALRMRAEEHSGRAEPLLATAISRTRWAGGHLAVALGGGVLVLLSGGLAFGVAGAISSGEFDLLPRVVAAVLAYIPAVWLTVGVAVLLLGLVPRAAPAVWLVVGYSFVAVYLGGFLQLPDWLQNLSPFGHVPQQPAAAFAPLPLLVLSLLAAVLVAAGLAGLARRDVRSPA